MEEQLPETQFIKIHKSYIVSLRHIAKTYSLTVSMLKKALPIGDTYREQFFETIQRMKL